MAAAVSPSTNLVEPKANLAEIRRGIAAFFRPSQVVEVRIPDTKRWGTISGYFSDHEAMAQAIFEADEKYGQGIHSGIYYVLNEINPDLIARGANRLVERAKNTTGDSDVLKRRYLFI